ncbi:hypothetical protein SDC9_03501 [bioreactor metagenome]|uniref:Uncharacterized protein n=1 Tax=bioreactor metagenome TaxID=1076179 RepID=A0A644STL3_9ZZZZ|nr:hypothetical protein [Methanobrevibacter sp.]MEA4956121.1 hypothetical protein [Methanobrevibacter sp.]
MSEPIILKAKNFDDMEDIAEKFLDNRYKIMSSDSKHVILKKRNFGTIYIHILLLFLILFVVSYNSLVLYILCIVYIGYFVFNLFKNSKIVLITTESIDKEGNPVEFNNIDDLDYS